MKKEYSEKDAESGIKEKLPKLKCWRNQFQRDYIIRIIIPEYTSLCPHTGLPDFGTITVEYKPDKWCLELKSLKYYILGFRNLGIFYENAVNRIRDDLVKACQPFWLKVTGEFNVRGGMGGIVEVEYVLNGVRS